MLTVGEVSRLIDRIYAAGETGEGWTDCLETIAEALHATGAHLFFHYDVSVGSDLLIAYARSDPAAMDAYRAHFHSVDPWEAGLPARTLPVGQVLTGLAVLSHADFQKTEYYADFARHFRLTRALFAVTGHNAEGTPSAVSITRGDHQSEFDSEAVAFLSVLIPHLRRALQVHDRWASVGDQHKAALEALDALPFAVLLVDGHGRVCFVNTRASARLAKRDGISLDEGRLQCANAAVTRRLRDLCAEIAATRAQVPRHPGAILHLPRTSSLTPLHALIAPVHARGVFSVRRHDVAAVLYISDPTEAAVPDEALLRAVYGLTTAEARVAALLATGRDLDEIADQFRYTRETTRWYVKQVLAKSGCQTRTLFAARAAASIAMLRSR
jgi:DNA-binding CsgD family transcriptional regulator